jgi:DNA repair exonuclease SbcCD ATPase subunit
MSDPLQEAFAELVGDMALDLATTTLNPALTSMHESWRTEATELRRQTAEWISRVNASRQHMDEVVERQHELAQEVYSTHARLMDDMAAFAKERRDALQWQEVVSTNLTRLNEVQRELSVESTRIAGVVRDIIGELARYQTEVDKRSEQLENKVETLLHEQNVAMKDMWQEVAQSTQAALSTLSKTNEETRMVIGRDLTALRRELQEVATRLGRELTDSRNAMQNANERRHSDLSVQLTSLHNKALAVLAVGEAIIIAALGYMLSRII